ncbi:MAG: 50S ribosomal protein L4 [Gemmataceae bacterium]|nr:50S ribosomal protein L4 [Gemmataceae bacterium]
MAVSSTTQAAISGPISVTVYNRTGQSVGNVSVDPAEFGGTINKQLLHDSVLMYRANQRAGTHSTLRRSEVAGSTKKLFKQKGTGNARAGNKRTNKRRGGGTAKGPKPRDYSYSLPRKALRAATRMAILSKLADNELTVIDDFGLAAPKTKEMAGVLKALKLEGVTCLISTDKNDPAIYRSGRNIRGVGVLPAEQLNAYEVLRKKQLVLTRAAFDKLRGAKA